ncbi:hypothetical protein GA830_15175 [Mesorhizobium sp. NBSH29]|uniref:hypothetical protein n=1 Tax=Mesorhizobium sp. NBSH29 TaxID=2654249 RepID=UPI0018964588|nr:hypothetical protein [Mesorhizobium sp. NBSH29]QPC87940.1 hypothetical protein GA830_15175 [Mesorhizobium sp. NBSH29]
MLQDIDDSAKQRLTEPADILHAILLLVDRGCPVDLLIVEMTKYFYVDLDAFEAVLDAEQDHFSDAA